MSEVFRKLKRMKPLLRAKQAKLDQEAAELAKVRNEKKDAMTELKRFERLYIESIEDLNKERQSPLRDRLDVLERSSDYYKSMWYQSLRRMRDIEGREKSQLSQLLMARQDFRSMEMLQQRYQDQVVQIDKSNEQKMLDETSIRAFVKNMP